MGGLPFPDGGIIVHQYGGLIQKYFIFRNRKHLRNWQESHAHQDIEGRVGELYPSDYLRLKILRRSDDGQQRNICKCSSCGLLFPHYEVKYAIDDQGEFFPYCKDCVVRKS